MDNTLTFKTTIKCGGCLGKVTPFLNEKAGAEQWNVDLQSPERRLTVTANNVTPQEIIAAVNKAGFVAEPLPS